MYAYLAIATNLLVPVAESDAVRCVSVVEATWAKWAFDQDRILAGAGT
ncbi:hypothetical protein AB0G02_19445 [Actinosynnema sp. NPDC023658]